MKRVYIPNDGGHNYQDAERFGELVFCLDNINRWSVSSIYSDLVSALADAEPDDYLMVSSLPIVCCIASAILAKRFGEVHYLLYKGDRYIHKELMLGNQDEFNR